MISHLCQHGWFCNGTGNNYNFDTTFLVYFDNISVVMDATSNYKVKSYHSYQNKFYYIFFFNYMFLYHNYKFIFITVYYLISLYL